MKYKLVKSTIKDNCLKEYIRMHDELPDEIRNEFHNIGIKKVVCFVEGNDLYVFTEFVDENSEELEKVTDTPVLGEFCEKLEDTVKDNNAAKVRANPVFIFENENY